MQTFIISIFIASGCGRANFYITLYYEQFNLQRCVIVFEVIICCVCKNT